MLRANNQRQPEDAMIEQITVTLDHIEEANRIRTEHVEPYVITQCCPLTLAAKDKFRVAEVSSSESYVSIRTSEIGRTMWKIDLRLHAQVISWDSKWKFEPGTYSIELYATRSYRTQ